MSKSIEVYDLFKVVLNNNLDFELHVEGIVVIVTVLLFFLLLILRCKLVPSLKGMEIDEAELGLGDQKIVLRPNNTDLQIAYKIWVELSTRKIGIPIDLNHDVISEIYDSWYSFFSITREHIKEVPATRFRRKDTERIIRLSIDVLNSGVRPHLTKWQARFRRWYERQIANEDHIDIDPQEIQKKFPAYDDLQEDLCSVNNKLIHYRQRLYELLTR